MWRGLCRKLSVSPMATTALTQLCCERSKLLRGGEAVGAELLFPDHVSRLDPSDRGGRGMERLEPLHRAGNPLYEAVIH